MLTVTKTSWCVTVYVALVINWGTPPLLVVHWDPAQPPVTLDWLKRHRKPIHGCLKRHVLFNAFGQLLSLTWFLYDKLLYTRICTMYATKGFPTAQIKDKNTCSFFFFLTAPFSKPVFALWRWLTGTYVAVLCYLGESNKSNHRDGPNAHRHRKRSEHTKDCWDYANLNYQAGGDVLTCEHSCR